MEHNKKEIAIINISKYNGTCALSILEKVPSDVEGMLRETRCNVQNLYANNGNTLQIYLRHAKKSRKIVEEIKKEISETFEKTNITCEIQYQYTSLVSNHPTYKVVFRQHKLTTHKNACESVPAMGLNYSHIRRRKTV